MIEENIDNLISKLKENIKNLSDRELLENIYIMLQINTMSNISANSVRSLPPIQSSYNFNPFIL